MPYEAEISRRNPACVLVLLDQSGSMSELLPAENTAKAQGVVDVVNNLIAELINRNTNGEEVFDRVDVGVITYGGETVATPLAENGLASLTQLAAKPLRVDTRQVEHYMGAGRTEMQTIVMPVWFDPISSGRTPMCQALERAKTILGSWTAAHPSSYPPILINVTDGEASDGNPTPHFQGLQSLSTQDGAALVINVLITQKANGTKVCYPGDSEEMWDEVSTRLFLGSSLLPDALRKQAQDRLERTLPAGARAVVLNAGMVELVQALDIGTRPVLV